MGPNQEMNLGTINVSDEVVANIASIATLEVNGVAGLSKGMISKILPGSQAKGVKAEVGQREAALDISIIVDYGVSIPDVAYQIQENVKRNVEAMTGLSVVEVNVYVVGAKEKEEKKKAKRVE